MRRIAAAIALACAGLTGTAATCSTAPSEITAERAIAIARSHVTFEPASTDARRITDEGRRVWRVTFQGKPFSPDHPLLRPILVVLVDRRSGEVTSVAKS